MSGSHGKNSSQPTLSAFFSNLASTSSNKRRLSSPVDLTLDSDNSDGVPPAKKPRKSGTTSPQFQTPAGPSRSSTGAAEQWRFTPVSPEKPASASVQVEKPRTEAEIKAQKQRREQFKKKLLTENNRFLNKKAETSAASDGIPTPDVIDVDESDGSENESDDAFKQLNEMFSNKQFKGKGKAKARADPPAKRTKKVVQIGPSGEAYTPLELQVLRLKNDNEGTVLMIEVGYKYKFFGDDATVAAKELGMVSFNDRNFLVASIPTHRRDVHLKKLLAQGYRVGIVNQIETAALKKVSDNRSQPFERKLMHLYTAATYVDDLNSVDDMERYTPPPFMCVIEEKKSANGADVHFGMITICPSTGDVVWDDFEDTLMRIELETRLVHTRPTELLLPRGGLTDATAKVLEHFKGTSSTGAGTRTEYIQGVMSYTDAFSLVSAFYTDKKKTAVASESFKSGKLMAEVADFPKRVVIALAHAIKHLSAFSIADAFLETKFFSKFTTRAHMLLAANTLTNLEIYRNETDQSAKGSLMWILDRTKTKFGARLLRSWVGRPLIDKRILQDRVDAVEEILRSPSEKLQSLRQLLKGLPDLAKGLCRIQYGQCTPQELAVLFPAFNKIAIAFETVESTSDVGFESSLLNDIIYSLPQLKGPMTELLGAVSIKRAAEGRKDTIWTDPERYPGIADADLSIQSVEVDLADELKAVRKLLKMPSLKWATVSGEEYVVDVKKSESKPIPASWHLLSKTKFFARYHTPIVKKRLEERARYQETLQSEANKAFRSFLEEISQKYYSVLRDAVNKLATADCLISFALVASQDNYVRPEFTDDNVLEIVEGRHPMVEALRSDPFVPNSVQMGGGKPGSKIITGPNMGGKSSSVRMIALIAIMAQIGSYVPAASVRLGLLDSVLTRMGASDDLAKGRSTFMVEMSETSDILHSATKNSLVILDELGRGTSTYDGMAIAEATLHSLVETTKCKTLFITHYPLVASNLEKKFPQDVENLHMGYEAESRIDGTREVTFLYRLTSGMASESFGIECGRLAGLSESILTVATDQASDLQTAVKERAKKNKIRTAAKVLGQCFGTTSITSLAALSELQMLVDSLHINTYDN